MIRYPTQRRFSSLRSPFDLLDELWSGSDGGQGDVTPAMDVRETDGGYVVEVSLPGIRPDDIDVTLDGRLLTVRGSNGSNRDEDEGRYLIRERRAMSFARSVTLPVEIDGDKVTSSFEDGELRLTLPVSSRAGAKRIAVSSGAKGARQVGANASHGAGASGSEPQSRGEGQHASSGDGQNGAGDPTTSESPLETSGTVGAATN